MPLSAFPDQIQILFLGSIFLGTLIISRFSIRLGIPAVLGVLLLGLLINNQGLNISFDDIESMHTFAVALLIYHAGLKTELSSIRGFLEYGVLLSIGGVAVSILVLGIGLFIISSLMTYIGWGSFDNGIPIGLSFLTAACLGSTDASASLSVIRHLKQAVPPRVSKLLEFESSVSNLVALIVFTILLEILSNSDHSSTLSNTFVMASDNFFQKLGAGMVIGLIFGYLTKIIENNLIVDREQLLIVGMSICFICFGVSYTLGGSGYVAVYMTGIFMANMDYRSEQFNHIAIQDVLSPFNTMTEISIFLFFGLLVEPLDLVPMIPEGIATALILMLIARPASVITFQSLSPFSIKETALISWSGIRGAVPLALSFELATHLKYIYNLPETAITKIAIQSQGVIVVAIIINLLVQGLTLPLLTRRLNIPPVLKC